MVDPVQLEEAHLPLVSLDHLQHVQVPLIISRLLVFQEPPDIFLELLYSDHRVWFRNELLQVDVLIQSKVLVKMHN